MTCSRISAAPSPPSRRDARRPQGACGGYALPAHRRIADPSRLCIVGWSYGGYAALIGVVREPQAVALNSIGTDKAELQIESPLRHADRIGDVRAMAKALSQHAVPNQLVRIKDGDWKRFSLRILRRADPRRS